MTSTAVFTSKDVNSLHRRETRRFARAWHSLSHAKPALVASVVLAIAILASIAAPLLSSKDPNGVDIMVRLQPPALLEDGSWANPLGTDQLGRDVLTRLLYGGRISFDGRVCYVYACGAPSVWFWGCYPATTVAYWMRPSCVWLTFFGFPIPHSGYGDNHDGRIGGWEP